MGRAGGFSGVEDPARRRLCAAGLAAAASAGLGACASAPRVAPQVDDLALLDRVTWGANASEARRLASMGRARWLAEQLRPTSAAVLPAAAQAQIEALTIVRTPVAELAFAMERQRKAFDAERDDERKKAAQQAYQQEMNWLAREAATRALLLAVYSPAQLQEQLTWFWFNHFNVHQYKANLRVLVGDYEDGLRARALGRFRDLLAFTTRHPAMLRYLDNERNAVNRLNENYARELLELHTLGVDGGYTQRDVQELARVLTGVGVNLTDPQEAPPPRLRPALAEQYRREGLFEFHPNRHDYGDKILLGTTVRGRGLAELDEVVDLLARHPSTARFIARKLALFFVADEPPPSLVDQLAARFAATDGDIAQVMAALLASPEFAASARGKFKDPLHYVVSAVRLAYDTRVVLNTGPMINWLNRMGQGLYNRQTPDGYPLTMDAWASAGQMSTRFEIAKAIGSGSAGLLRVELPEPMDQPGFPQLANPVYYGLMQTRLSAPTQRALAKASSPQEWNLLLLASPEFMMR